MEGGGGGGAGIKARKTKMTSSPHNYHQCTKFHDPTTNLGVFLPAVLVRNVQLLTRNEVVITIFGKSLWLLGLIGTLHNFQIACFNI